MQIHVLPASAGPLWLRDGWRLFRRQPLGLPAMVVVYVFMLVSPMLLPFIGPAASGVLSPFATLGLMTAVRDTAAGRMPTPAAFAQGFQDPVRRVLLFRLGLINAGLLVLAALGSLLFVPEPPPEATVDALESFPLRALLMQLLLYLPAIVLMWFAPMLAGWHGLGPGKAMFGSAVACWRNLGALLAYGVVTTLVLGGIGLIALAVLEAFVQSNELSSMLLAPLGLVLMTIVQASLYPMYRSIFSED
jgi:hypothetical protein